MPHPAIAVGRDAERHEEVSAVGGGLEVLGAGCRPADRPAEMEGEPGDEDLLGIEVRLGAEPAADFGSDGPDALLRDPRMRATLDLTRCADWVEVHMVIRSPSTRAATARGSIALGIRRWIRKSSETSNFSLGCLRGAFGMEFPHEGPVPLDIGIERLRPVGAGNPRISGSGQVPVIHEDQRRRVGRLFGRLGHHRDHRIAHREHLLVGERPAGGKMEFGERAGVGARATGKGFFRVGRMSAAVKTPATPGAAAASSVSISTISACG